MTFVESSAAVLVLTVTWVASEPNLPPLTGVTAA